MRQFVYISTAPGLSEDQVDEIVKSASRNNAKQNIGGFLLYNGRNFLQLLEGEGSQLLLLMSHIMTDPRHTGVLKLEDIPLEHRICEKWNMRRIRIGSSVSERRKLLDEQLPDGLDPQVLRLVRNFAALN
ncbi:BLUF domain-containing protein [Altererythrobacter sp. ZODW24]|uniref:BLUF domain-containing protein n=1 Tax=Altererythrobacter sp. ZODW24 TaxID=2185142 RepID=UPI000DF73AF9|nr:BLUF domain-containing protein [Altererythrobacter sp. ZODW24]